ncbi:hypothetical protein COLO4_27799 [Corchorus olitorius]|uniref:Prolyl endopeptidase-like n=1 Tax=Corchorus olitorius TaxID=93759 RepID=A0A1R3HP20_9ROSI|nr:hypothetical protein COLO4_27799 [Corchorus olitorius]
MEDFWKRAKSFAEEAAKKSQTLTVPNKFSDLVAETAKKSKELALEASKKADELKTAALKQADQIHIQNFSKSITDIIPPQLSSKSISDIIPPQLSSLSITSPASSSSDPPPISESELRKFGLTDDLRDFVRGFTSDTFRNFPSPAEDEPEPSDATTIPSNVRKDLSEWQERHATLVLTTVKEIKKLRYELCPRVMKERKFWRIYFTLVSTHVAPYEKQYMEEVKQRAEEAKEDNSKQTPVKTEAPESDLQRKTSIAEQDLDTFLLGDFEDSDGGGGTFIKNFCVDCGFLMLKMRRRMHQELKVKIADKRETYGRKVRTIVAMRRNGMQKQLLVCKIGFRWLGFGTVVAESISAPSQLPPIPKQVPFTVSLHGHTWQDPYCWMRNTDDPDFLNYLTQENSYARDFMADTQSLQRTLVTEMKSRMPSSVYTPVERYGPWLYYEYIPEGKEYPVFCRRLSSEKCGYVHVGQCRISPDHNFLAYTLDMTGSEHFMLQIKDLRNGYIIPRAPVDKVVSLAWAQDCKTLVLCMKVGLDNADDALVYIVDSTDPLSSLQRIHKRVSGVQFFLEHHFGFFYILTNAPMKGNMKCYDEGYYLARCRVGDIQSTTWQNIFYPSEDTSLQDMDIFNGHLVLSLNKKGFPMLCSVDLPINVDCKHQMRIEDLDPWFFPIPSNSCSIAPGSNLDFMNSVYRVVLSSPVMPDLIVDYDMSRRIFSIVQQEEVLGISSNAPSCSSRSDLDSQQQLDSEKDENNQNVELQRWKVFTDTYSCEREEVISHDGIRVPLTILYSQKAWRKGQSPGILLGYGAYGEVLDKSWCGDRLSLLDRGWVVAFADVRGGGGGESSWHKSGSGLFKQNSIYDFVSCGKFLIDEGYVQRNRLGAIGVSAGSVLIGAALNMYPDLFRAAILKVPFLDILNSLLDPSLPLTILDYEEFGNPQIKSQFESILSYSPYENISQGVCHPSVLVTASFNDSRVGVWEAAKWVAKVRDSTCSSCSRSVILKTNMTGGHFGEGGRYIQCEETAYDYAFLVKAMGINIK